MENHFFNKFYLFIIYFICFLFLKDLFFLKNIALRKMSILQNANNSINKIDDDRFFLWIFCFATMSLITLLLI